MTKPSTEETEEVLSPCPVCKHATPHAESNGGRYVDLDEIFCEGEYCMCTAFFRDNALAAIEASRDSRDVSPTREMTEETAQALFEFGIAMSEHISDKVEAARMSHWFVAVIRKFQAVATKGTP